MLASVRHKVQKTPSAQNIYLINENMPVGAYLLIRAWLDSNDSVWEIKLCKVQFSQSANSIRLALSCALGSGSAAQIFSNRAE